jgi:hypothetical protein
MNRLTNCGEQIQCRKAVRLSAIQENSAFDGTHNYKLLCQQITAIQLSSKFRAVTETMLS